MQKESFQRPDRIAGICIVYRVIAAFVINFIADDREIYRCKMDADLVRAAGFDLYVKQSEFLEPFSDFP